MWSRSCFSHGKKRFPWGLQLGSKSFSERGTGRAKHHPIAAAGCCEHLLDPSRSLSDGEVRVKTIGLLPSPVFAFWGFSLVRYRPASQPNCSAKQWDMTAVMAGRASSQNPDVEPGSCRLPSGGEACSSLPWMNSPLNFPGLGKKPKATPSVILRLNAMIFPCKKKKAWSPFQGDTSVPYLATSSSQNTEFPLIPQAFRGKASSRYSG